MLLFAYCHCDKSHYAESVVHYAECHYAECQYAKSSCGKCHGAILAMILQVAGNKSRLLLRTTLQSKLTLQLFTINIKMEIIYKS